MATTRTESALISECASAHGVSVRSVQRWRESGDKRWNEFLKIRAKQSAGQTSLFAARGEKLSPEQEEDQAAARYAGLAELADLAIQNKNSLEMVTLIKASQEAYKLLSVVREKTLAYHQASGRLIELEVVFDYLLGPLSLVKNRMEGLKDILSARIESSSDVRGIVDGEVTGILRELSSAVKAFPGGEKLAKAVTEEKNESELPSV